MRKAYFLLLAFYVTTIFVNAQKTPKPPMMGYATWNAYHVSINDSIIRSTADKMVSHGLLDAGYKYLNIDDGYFNGRDAEGNMLIHPTRFPNGMKSVVDYIHSKGLKAGLYGDAGINTCASIWESPPDTGGQGAGFYNHEEKDMEFYFNTLGADYLKVDYCGASQQDLKLDEETHYTKIKEAIDKTGATDYIFNVCRWEFPGTWVTKIADSWRISYDINPTFDRMLYILDLNTFLAPFMSPGHYNDMDMLEVGNGTLSKEMNKAQMSLWSVLTSPLVIGTDLGKVKEDVLEILKNEEVIAVNQDMTEQGHLISDYGDSKQIWSKKLNGKQSGERAVVLFNRSNAHTKITVNFADLDLGPNVTIRDLWTHEDLGEFTDSYTATVMRSGAVMLKITGTNVNPKVYEAEYAYMNNFHHLVNTEVIPNQARATQMNAVSKNAIATDIGGNAENYIEFRDIFVDEDGTYPLTISYLCGEDRTATMLVNGEKVDTKVFNSGSSSTVATQSLYIELKAEANTIRFENETSYAPDLDKITIGDKDGELPGILSFEAEDATLTAGLSITNNALASGEKLVEGLGSNSDESISFPTFEVENSAGLYPLTVFFSNIDDKRPLQISTDVKNYDLNDLQSPTQEIGKITMLVQLNKGENSIKLSSSKLAPAIDKIELDLSRTYSNIINLEAENGRLISNASNQPRISDQSNASGGKVVGWLGNSSEYKVVFDDVKVAKDGNYELKLYYFTGEARNVTIKINGTDYQFTDLHSGGWDTQAVESKNEIPFLAAGNSIEIFNPSGWGTRY